LAVNKDLAKFSYTTTLGLAQFHEQVLNRFAPTVRSGRPPKDHTGKRGQPSKAKSSKKAVEAALAKNCGRNRKGETKKAKDIELDMEVDAR
jgi:hypothetical protein